MPYNARINNQTTTNMSIIISILILFIAGTFFAASIQCFKGKSQKLYLAVAGKIFGFIYGALAIGTLSILF